MPFNLSAKYKKNRIRIKFNQDVIPTGGEIKLRGTSPKSQILETIKIGSPKISGDVYSLESMLWDYSYNSIALDNYDIFSRLASHDKKKISDKTNEEWAFDLRMGWNVSIDGKLYRLDKDQDISADEAYNYHATTPEYTPGKGKSGNTNIVLSPLQGIRTLSIKPSKRTLQSGNLGSIDISGLGLISPKGGLNEKLELPVESKKIQNIPNTKKPEIPASGPNIFWDVFYQINRMQGLMDRRGDSFKNNDVITGRFFTGNSRGGDGESKLVLFMNPWDLKPKGHFNYMIGEHMKGNPNIFYNKYRTKEDKPFGVSVKSGKLTQKHYNRQGKKFATVKYNSIEAKEIFEEEKSFFAKVTFTHSEKEMVFKAPDDGEILATATFAQNVY